jgi:hypothetical protein
MSGDPISPTPDNGMQNKPADNPPSLSEPSQRRVIAPPALTEQPALYSRTDATPVNPTATAIPEQQQTADDSFYHPEDEAAPTVELPVGSGSPDAADKVVEWISTGDELQSRSAAWRTRMSLISLGAGAVVYLITRDLVSTGSVVFVGLLFGFLGARKPPALQYRLDRRGIVIGRKHYSYNEFRAFSVVDEAQTITVNLVPLKRFLPVLAIFCDPKFYDEVIGMLGQHLPMEVHKRDAFDSIINRVKF